MNDTQHTWARLVAAARRAPDERDTTAPYGFSTRVAALAAERAPVSLFARYSLRALGVACLLAIASVAANYSAIAGAFSDEPAVAADDPVAEAVSIAS